MIGSSSPPGTLYFESKRATRQTSSARPRDRLELSTLYLEPKRPARRTSARRRGHVIDSSSPPCTLSQSGFLGEGQMIREHSVRTAHGSKLTGSRFSRPSLGCIDDQPMCYENLSTTSIKKKSRMCRHKRQKVRLQSQSSQPGCQYRLGFC